MGKASSDLAFWHYNHEEQRLIKLLKKREKELYYLDLKEALHDFLTNEDVAQKALKHELFKILDEHQNYGSMKGEEI